MANLTIRQKKHIHAALDAASQRAADKWIAFGYLVAIFLGVLVAAIQ